MSSGNRLQSSARMWLLVAHERRAHSSIYGFGSRHPNREGARMADNQDRSRNVGGFELHRCYEAGAKGGAVIGHHSRRVYALKEKRTELSLIQPLDQPLAIA